PEGTDQTYPFYAHPEYCYLTGIDSPGGVLAFDPRQRSSKRWVSFVPGVTEAEKMWEGRTQLAGTSLPRLEPWLGARRGRPIINLGAPLRGVRSDESDVAQPRLPRAFRQFGDTFERVSASVRCRLSSKPNSSAMTPTVLVIQRLWAQGPMQL